MVTILFRYGLQAAPKMQTDILTLDKLGLVGNVNPIQASLQNIICKSLGPFLASMHLLHLVHDSISIAQFVLAKRSAGITLTTTGGIFIVCVCELGNQGQHQERSGPDELFFLPPFHPPQPRPSAKI